MQFEIYRFLILGYLVYIESLRFILNIDHVKYEQHLICNGILECYMTSDFMSHFRFKIDQINHLGGRRILCKMYK